MTPITAPPTERPQIDLMNFQNLEQAFRWAIAQDPPVIPEDVVIQDEYTHDVLFRASDDCYFVFDTT